MLEHTCRAVAENTEEILAVIFKFRVIYVLGFVNSVNLVAENKLGKGKYALTPWN